MKVKSAILTLLALCLLIIGCNPVSPSYNRENIKGGWIVNATDENPLPIEQWSVMKFNDDYTITVESIVDTSGVDPQWGSNTLSYSVYCCDMNIFGNIAGIWGFNSKTPIDIKLEYALSTDTLTTLAITSAKVKNKEITPSISNFTLKKLPAKYDASDSLYGIWQIGEYRMQFKPLGELVLYTKSGGNQWEQMGSDESYRKYGSFLVITTTDNPAFGKKGATVSKMTVITILSPSRGIMEFKDDNSSHTLTFISPN